MGGGWMVGGLVPAPYRPVVDGGLGGVDRVAGFAQEGTGGSGGDMFGSGFVEMFHRGLVGLMVPLISTQSSTSEVGGADDALDVLWNNFGRPLNVSLPG